MLENGWAKAYETKDAEFVMEITARNIVLVSKDSGTPKFGKADIYVDDKLALTADPLVNGWDHRPDASQFLQRVLPTPFHSK